MRAFSLWCVTASAWWILALAPLAAAPEWLQRTREVCFGSMPRGLPEAQGWLMLSAPLPLLLGVGILWGDRLRRSRLGLLLLVASLPLATLVWGALRLEQGFRAERAISQSSPASGPLPAEYPRLDRALPAMRLVDMEGRPVDSGWFRGRPTLLTFAFAHCQTICPRLMGTVASVPSARVAVITLDPWRDTCGGGSSWEGEATVLTGEIPEVNRVLDELNVARQRDPQTGDVTHAGLVYVVDREGRLAYAFLNPSADWLREALGRQGP